MRRQFLSVCVMALMLAGQSALAQEAASSPPAPAAAGNVEFPVSPDTILILVRSTLVALDQANKTGNYSVLRDLGAPSFRAANNQARLTDIFAPQRAQGLDLSAVAILEPKLRRPPVFTAEGLLHVTGFVPSGALQVNFEFLFSRNANQYEIFGLSVDLVPAEPVAAAEAPAPAAPAASSQASGKATRQRGTAAPLPSPRP